MDKEEAMKILKDFHDKSALFSVRTALGTLHPELVESEDEKTRKRIIALINAHGQGMYKGDMLAWLEKQGNIDKASYEIAEKEKREFVGDGFIKCYADFQDFIEEETYWLEYVGNDDYNVRSDNLLGKTYHITPCQLYTIFKKTTWLEKQGEQKPPIEMKSAEESLGVDSETYNKIVDECIYGDDKQKHDDKVKPKFKVGDYIERKDGLGCHAKIIFVGGNVYGCEKIIYSEDSFPFFELMFENQDEFKISSDFQQKPAWREEDDDDAWMNDIISKVENNLQLNKAEIDWLKSLKQRIGG